MTCIVVNGPCAGDRKRRPHTNLIAGDKRVVSESCNILKSERMSDVKWNCLLIKEWFTPCWGIANGSFGKANGRERFFFYVYW